jgi:hypothetical protein
LILSAPAVENPQLPNPPPNSPPRQQKAQPSRPGLSRPTPRSTRVCDDGDGGDALPPQTEPLLPPVRSARSSQAKSWTSSYCFSLALLQLHAAAFRHWNASVPAHPRSLLMERINTNKSFPQHIRQYPRPGFFAASVVLSEGGRVLLNLHQHILTLHLHRIHLHPPLLRRRRNPRRHIERPRMPRTQHRPILNPSPTQRPLPMRTDIPQRRKPSLHIRQTNRHTPSLSLHHLVRPRSLRHPA